MAGENTVSTLNGLFKTVYADKLLELVPDYAIVQKRVPFVSADKETGNYYAQPVSLTHEAGFTYLGETGAVTALNGALNATMKEAQVKGSELVLRSQMSYAALSRASTQGAKAFKRLSSFKVEDMNNSMRKRLEVAMLYGQSGVGKVSAINTGVITITDATWAGGIWAGSEGAILEAWTGATATETQHNTDLTISAVDPDAKTITVTGTSSAVVANDILYFKGARTSSAYNEMAGLQKIIGNTGTLFNISASSYNLWKGNSITSVGQLSHGKIQDALAKAVNKGLMEDVIVLLSPKAFAVLNTDQAALRTFDSSYSSSTAKNGSQSLTFYSANGKVEICSHPFVKDGDAFIVAPDDLMRIGSTDVSFGVPGMDEQFFTLVSGYNAVELQCMCDQAIFIEKPAHATYMSGLTYT
jgi:hypothetical protein